MTPERNGTGWRLATVLGALLCTCIGALVSGVILYNGHLSWAATRSVEIETRIAGIDIVRSDVAGLKVDQGLMRKAIQELSRSVDRLADSNCYRDTGKPCSRALLDERP